MTRTHSGSGVLVILAFMIIVAVVGVLAIPTLGSIQLRPHAVQRHAADADRAREWISAHAGPGNRYDCGDGRTRIVLSMPSGEWAVMVLEAGVEITSFVTTSQDYVRKILEPCDQYMKFAHP